VRIAVSFAGPDHLSMREGAHLGLVA